MPTEQPSWVLAIDTSTDQASLALTDGQRVSALSWPAGRDQTVSALAELDHLLEVTRVDRAALGAIGVATGPGMFNGVRVGMSVAKGLHLGLRIPLIGVSTLEATAFPFLDMRRPVVAVVAAGRGRVIWSRPGDDDSPMNVSLEELHDALTEHVGEVIVAGDLTAEQAARLSGVPGVIVPPVLATPSRASAIAVIAWRKFRAGAADDPVLLAPIYVHGRATTARG
jgi:tRNA threonylcarbamoyladenosine biosynthesis protein TsaB